MALLHPLFCDKVASATSATMILFTSATAAMSFILFGLLPFDYGLALLVFGFISTCVGQVVCYYGVVWGGGSCTSTVVTLTCVPPYIPLCVVVLPGGSSLHGSNVQPPKLDYSVYWPCCRCFFRHDEREMVI